MRSHTLRIIAGQWRGRRLPVATLEGLRPTADRVRETLFNWLGPHTISARCLDAFAGSGALGLEALSREAAHVTFLDTQGAALNTLRQSIERLGCAAQTTVLRADANCWLDRPAEQPFDIVFLDPPFVASGQLEVHCRLLLQRNWIERDSLVYLEGATLPTLPTPWSRKRQSRAGQTHFALYGLDAHEG